MSTPAALDEHARVGTLSVPGLTAQPLLTTGLAAIIVAVAFAADGGLQLGRTTPAEMALMLGGGAGGRRRAAAGAAPSSGLWGGWSLLALLALAVLTALSVSWAANPPTRGWRPTARSPTSRSSPRAVALAHAVPGRWGAVLGAITLAAVAISAYAVATKIAPGLLNPDETFARLREPFGYWNSVGLMAACGVPGVLWLGTRRTGHQTLNALAYPALGLLLLTILLSYSRGALLAAAVGAGFWLAAVGPLRLRASAVLLCGVTAAASRRAWAF